MNYLMSKPHTMLSPYIQFFWTIEDCNLNHSEHIQRIVPNGLPEIFFYFGSKPDAVQQQHSVPDNAVLSGQQQDFYDLKFTGSYSIFSIIFKPQGLSMFTNVPISEFSNRNISLRDVFPADFNELEDNLGLAHSFAERVAIAENFFWLQLQKRQVVNHFNRIDHCIRLINQRKGCAAIDDLSSAACLSRKQFERVFAGFVGTSPKQFLKTVRFQNTLNEKSIRKDVSLTELAYQCGYYDQSHMINDFRQLSGLSPKEYFAECEPTSDYFFDSK